MQDLDQVRCNLKIRAVRQSACVHCPNICMHCPKTSVAGSGHFLGQDPTDGFFLVLKIPLFQFILIQA